MSSSPSRIPVTTGALLLAALIVWSVALWRATEVFGPGSNINNVSFNSDSAINVLMANDDRPITIFNFYYYGADRWGAWAFLVAQGIRRATGYFWTPESLTALQAAWVFLGAWALAGLDRRDCWLVGATYLVVLCLHAQSRYLLFELSQIYAWQNTATLLSWYFLRRLFDGVVTPTGETGEAGEPRPASLSSLARLSSLAWLLLAFVAAYLAVWASVASAVFLVFLVGVEVIRARAKRATGWFDRRLWVSGVVGVAVVAGAVLLERFQKDVYRDYSARTYGNPFVTTFTIDWEYLGRNFGQHWHSLVTLSWWPLYVVPAVAMIASAGAFAYAIVGRKPDLRARLRTALTGDTAMLAMATYGMAIINFALAVIVSHVRFNDYDTRYLTLTNLFAPISAVLTIFVVVMFAIRRPRARAIVRAICAPAMVALLLIAFPAPRDAADYRQLKRTALSIARKAPNGVLMGTYWDTYVFSAIQPQQQAMIPVPFEGGTLRTPWTLAALNRARDVIVAYPLLPRQPYAPEPTLRQYGRTLTLVDPHWFDDQAYAFARYTSVPSAR